MYRRLQYLYVLVLAAILVSGCIAAPPKPSGPDSSGFVVRIGFTQMLSPAVYADILYIVRVDETTGIIQPDFITSNYASGGYAFYLNAEPGTYTIVGARASSLGLVSSIYHVFFSEELVSKIRITVERGKLVFANSYAIGIQLGVTDADPVQKHYKSLIIPTVSTNDALMMLRREMVYSDVSFKEKSRDEARDELIRRSRSLLPGSKWSTMIR